MRVIVYGVGAIGGTIAARLSLQGTEVIGIARGQMLSAINGAGGLTLLSHAGRQLATFPCVSGPSEIQWRADDITILTMKSNDTAAALAALHAAGADQQPVICAQNGVANEPMALRYFPNVYGMVVMMPAEYLDPGVVISPALPKFGLFDLGRYPEGVDDRLDPLISAFNKAGFVAEMHPEVMAGKYGKLRVNLTNILGAALGLAAREGKWVAPITAEADAVFAAAGIKFYDVDMNHPRRKVMKRTPIEGITLHGSSSVQSLLRGTGSIETNFLNGEIVLLGRQHGIPTPINEIFVSISQEMVRDKSAPGSFPVAEVERRVAAAIARLD